MVLSVSASAECWPLPETRIAWPNSPSAMPPRSIGQLFERLGEPASEEIGRRYRRQEDEKDREGHVASEVVEE